MPRYYFHILCADGTKIPDEEGMDCQDLATARHEAKLNLREVSSAALKEGADIKGLIIEIADANGNTIAQVQGGSTFH